MHSRQIYIVGVNLETFKRCLILRGSNMCKHHQQDKPCPHVDLGPNVALFEQCFPGMGSWRAVIRSMRQRNQTPEAFL